MKCTENAINILHNMYTEQIANLYIHDLIYGKVEDTQTFVYTWLVQLLMDILSYVREDVTEYRQQIYNCENTRKLSLSILTCLFQLLWQKRSYVRFMITWNWLLLLVTLPMLWLRKHDVVVMTPPGWLKLNQDKGLISPFMISPIIMVLMKLGM